MNNECITVFCPQQEQIVHVLRPLCGARVRRAVLHEGTAEAEPATSVSAVVAQPGHLQVSQTAAAPT